MTGCAAVIPRRFAIGGAGSPDSISGMNEWVCESVSERERLCVRERERESVCVCVCECISPWWSWLFRLYFRYESVCERE